MHLCQPARFRRAALLISLLFALLAPLPAAAQSIWNLRTENVGRTSVSIKWENGHGSDNYLIYVDRDSGERTHVGNTRKNSYYIKGLRPSTTYLITLYHDHTALKLNVQTRNKRERRQFRYVPPPVTCPYLPARVVITGYVVNTQCQMVGDVVISMYPDLQARGFVDAVDVWSYVNGGLEVCFYNDGWLVFLDAAYSPRVATELEHTHRDGMTCGVIDRAGTVVLLAAGPGNAPTLQGPAAPDTPTLPVFESIPLHDCQIKLVETLFLRSEPAGEIIGLVWLNTVVSAFEINGYWYKIEFEGKTGYISRYYREVMRGGYG